MLLHLLITANRDGVELCVDFGVDPIGTRIDTAIDTSTTRLKLGEI